MATNGGIATNPQQQLNGILNQDREKQSVAVHTFNPDSTPEQKAASAGKGSNQLKSVQDKGDESGGKGEPCFEVSQSAHVTWAIVLRARDFQQLVCGALAEVEIFVKRVTDLEWSL